MRALAALLPLALGLAACGDLAVPAAPGETPGAYRGVWGADCARPFMQLEARRIRVFADSAAHDLTAVVHSGDKLDLRYATPQGEVSETYVRTGGVLRLTRGTYGKAAGKPGVTVIWNKAPMKKCPVSSTPTT